MKPLYFVNQEKKVRHIGFYDEGDLTLLESREVLESQGFREDTSLLREAEDSGYFFSAFVPSSVVDLWFSQLLVERSKIKPKNESRKEEIRIFSPPKRTKSHVIHGIFTPKKRYEPKKVPPLTVIHPVLKRVVKKKKKTIDMLKEEIEGKKRWESFVPTCGECVFWERQVLQYTQVEMGSCKVTGNFVNQERKACSEFEKI